MGPAGPLPHERPTGDAEPGVERLKRRAADTGRFVLGALRRPTARVAAAAFALVVAAAGLFGTHFYSGLADRLPSELDWRATAVLLERDARPGDAAALAPMWAERAREVLPATLPVMALPRYGRDEDLVGVRRVWLLALTSAPGYAKAIEEDLTDRAATIDGPQRLGAIEVTRFDLRAPTLPLAFLPDRLAAARVSLGDRPCLADGGGRFRCPAPPHVRVSREVREIDYLPRPCIYAHPGPDPKAPLTVEIPDVPMGRALRGHTGIIGDAMLGGEAPVRMEVKVDGEPLAVVEEPPRTPGWHPFQLDTTRHASRTRTVTFSITAAEPNDRTFCFDAMTLP